MNRNFKNYVQNYITRKNNMSNIQMMRHFNLIFILKILKLKVKYNNI